MSQFKPNPKTDLLESAFRLSLNYTPNPNYRSWNPRYRDTFGDLTRWIVDGNGITEDDAINYSVMGYDKREDGTWVKTSGHAIKLTKSSTTTRQTAMELQFSNPLNLDDHHSLLRYYIHEGGEDDLTAIYFYMIDMSGNYAKWVDIGYSGFRKGWRTQPYQALTYTNDPGFDATNVSKLKIMIQTKTGSESATPSVTFDALDFIPKLTGQIPYIMTADGGYTNQKEVLAYMASRGIRCHLYVTYDRIGTSGYMNLKELREAQAMGHIIDVHERDKSPVGWVSMTKEQKVQSLRESLMWKAEHGFLEGRGFCPLGAQWYHDEDDLEFLLPYVEHVRIGSANNNIPWNPRIIGVSYDTNYLNLADEPAKRQAAIDRGTYYVGLIHSLKGTFTIEDAKTMIDNALDDPNVKFMTISELINSDFNYISN